MMIIINQAFLIWQKHAAQLKRWNLVGIIGGGGGKTFLAKAQLILMKLGSNLSHVASVGLVNQFLNHIDKI